MKHWLSESWPPLRSFRKVVREPHLRQYLPIQGTYHSPAPARAPCQSWNIPEGAEPCQWLHLNWSLAYFTLRLTLFSSAACVPNDQCPLWLGRPSTLSYSSSVASSDVQRSLGGSGRRKVGCQACGTPGGALLSEGSSGGSGSAALWAQQHAAPG